MNLDTKLKLLDQMVDIYDRFVGDFDLACEKYCAHCCTANVTMTTLEGYRILSHLEKNDELNCLETIARLAHPERFVPGVSINRMADICARDGDPPDEHLNPDAGPCPVLWMMPVRSIRCGPLAAGAWCPPEIAVKPGLPTWIPLS
jgi:hypothetical protein